jgi:hypothetical protein
MIIVLFLPNLCCNTASLTDLGFGYIAAGLRQHSHPLFRLLSGWSVGQIAAGLRQHSQSWFRVPLGLMAIHLLISIFLSVLKWGLPFEEMRGLTTKDHSLSTGGDWSGHSFTNWPFPPHTHTHTHTSTHFWLTFRCVLGVWYDTDGTENTAYNSSFYCCMYICCWGNVFTEPFLATAVSSGFTIPEDTETHRQQNDFISLLLGNRNRSIEPLLFLLAYPA